MDFKYNGIILSKKDVGEADRIYTIFTLEAGKIRALAKGIRRPNAKLAGSLEPVTYSEVFIAKGKGLGKITGALVVDNFSKIKSDLDSLNQGAYVFGILEKIISDQEKDEKIFNLFLKYLTVMENLSGTEDVSKKDIITLGFLFKLLAELGYQLEVEKCPGCGEKLKPEKNYFSAVQGGILCVNCAEGERRKIVIENESIKFIRIFFRNKVENLVKLSADRKNTRNLQAVMKEFLDWAIK